jgi:hypothetical protein
MAWHYKEDMKPNQVTRICNNKEGEINGEKGINRVQTGHLRVVILSSLADMNE